MRVRAFIMGYNRNVNMCTTFYSAKTNERASIYYGVRCVRAPVPDDKCALRSLPDDRRSGRSGGVSSALVMCDTYARSLGETGNWPTKP